VFNLSCENETGDTSKKIKENRRLKKTFLDAGF